MPVDPIIPGGAHEAAAPPAQEVAFTKVERHGREFHVYGSGQDRQVFEIGRATAPRS
jgi:hypothetical protein